jgi:hypothetical protein
VEWNIKDFSTKLKNGMGRAVVSAAFNLCGLEEVRFMVAPMMQQSNVGPRTRKEKEEFSKMVTNGPLDAALMLKVPNARPCVFKYYLGVGNEKTGPHECDFSNTAIDKRGSFGINWFWEMNKDSSITVSVEMLPPSSEKLEDQGMLAAQEEEASLLPDDISSLPSGSVPCCEARSSREESQ